MLRDLEGAIDECLACLDRGKSLESCLERFPAYRDELEPLLRTAAIVCESYRPPQPPPEALARVKATFMATAEEYRRGAEHEAEHPPSFWQQMLAWWTPKPGLGRALASISLVLVLLVGVLSGGSMVSANSIPGDTFYGVKRASENVRVFLTVDVEERAALQQEFDERRVDEVKQVIEKGREVDVDFSGTVEAVLPDHIVINGLQVALSPQVSKAKPVVGAELKIDGQTRSDGSIAAEAVSVVSAPEPTKELPTPLPEPTATPQPEQRPTEVPTATLAPPTEEPPKPTETPEPTAEPTEVYTATPEPTATGTAPATPTPPPTNTAIPTATFTPLPTNTPAPPPRDIGVRIEGLIESITQDYWHVAGEHISVRSSTSINQDAAPAAIGGWAVVNASKMSNGSLVARDIRVVRGPDQPPVPKEFSGTIESIGADQWIVSGHAVLIDGNTSIEGSTPQVGAIAHIKAEQHSDGRLVALRITVEKKPEQVVQFEGIIGAIVGDRWVVAGQEILIGPDTQISGTPAVGALAEVEAVVQADGTKLARHISIQALPTSTPLPPTATPQPMATEAPAEPTATPVVDSTPIAPTPRA